MKLATYKDDHFELENAESRHSEAPDNFWIPSIEVRNNLRAGDLIKLIFSMEDQEQPSERHVERMWVEVLAKEGEMYIGRLDNDPLSNVMVKADDTIHFKAEHVIAVYDDKDT